MNKFTATMQLPRTFNLRLPWMGLELPVLTPERPRTARIVSTEPDGSGSSYGWQIVLAHNRGMTQSVGQKVMKTVATILTTLAVITNVLSAPTQAQVDRALRLLRAFNKSNLVA